MASSPAPSRRDREQHLVRATRALFDERGMQDAPIEEIAKAVGIARGLIYRHFASKEELYVLTVTDYLAELDAVLRDALDDRLDPRAQLEAWARAYAGFCLRYPAFLDCALSLMRRPARDLREALSQAIVHKGWPLRRLELRRQSLEDAFFNVLRQADPLKEGDGKAVASEAVQDLSARAAVDSAR